MRQLQETARRDLDAALLIEPRLTEAYTILIDQASGEKGTRACRALADKAFAFAPGNLRIWERLLSCLEPRWGGTLGELQAAANEAQRDARRNARLLALRGWIYGDQAWSAGIAADREHEAKNEENRKMALEMGVRLWGQAPPPAPTGLTTTAGPVFSSS